jgi:hypothetical protein
MCQPSSILTTSWRLARGALLPPFPYLRDTHLRFQGPILVSTRCKQPCGTGMRQRGSESPYLRLFGFMLGRVVLEEALWLGHRCGSAEGMLQRWSITAQESNSTSAGQRMVVPGQTVLVLKVDVWICRAGPQILHRRRHGNMGLIQCGNARLGVPEDFVDCLGRSPRAGVFIPLPMGLIVELGTVFNRPSVHRIAGRGIVDFLPAGPSSSCANAQWPCASRFYRPPSPPSTTFPAKQHTSSNTSRPPPRLSSSCFATRPPGSVQLDLVVPRIWSVVSAHCPPLPEEGTD